MKNIRTRGFTLIELMIVVTIISILASIAVPSLLRARMNTNETAAIATLKDIHTGQTIYRRTDWNKDGIFQYAFPFYRLAKESGQDIELIPKNIAASGRYTFPNPAPPYGVNVDNNGYILNDSFGLCADAPPYAYVQNFSIVSGSYLGTQRFGAHITPASYYLTGINSYLLDDKGVVWQRDLGATAGVSNYWNVGYGAGILKGNNWTVSE